MRPTRVLCYAPYNRWRLHGLFQTTILHALRLRGAEVQQVLCDGLFTDCDQFWESIEPRPTNACTLCQAQVTGLMAELNMDYHWLGRYLTTDETREAKRWAQSLARDELLTATYGTWRVAEWVRSSVQSHFRTIHIDPAEPRIERILRSYLYSGLIACFALDRLLEESAPDVLFVLNGRASSTRVALELARARDIRVIVHERTRRNEAVTLHENVNGLSLEPVRRSWREWGDLPLNALELEEITSLMAGHEHGRDLGWTPLTAAPQPEDEVLSYLGLRGDRPIWALFTSSDDELSGHEDWGSSFPSQLDWIERTIDHARRHPEMDLVIRVHPNTGSRRSHGANRLQLEQMRALAEDLPLNVRMIQPDEEVSSYSLMNLCTAGLVWVSTVGLELACKGKTVVVAAGNFVADTSFVHTVQDTAGYEELLDSLLSLPQGAVLAEIRRLALRFAYLLWFRLPIDFPLVNVPVHNQSRLAYDSLDGLLPGRDSGLDRIAGIILDGDPLCPSPTEQELARSTEAEDAFLEKCDGQRLMVLAFADELIADVTLLEAWDATLGDHDGVTLLIHTPAADTRRLVEAVTRAGLDRDDGPDLVAGELDADTMASVGAVFSRVSRNDGLEVLPRYDLDSLSELAEYSRSISG